MIGRCSICTNVFDPTEIAALKCGHTFHLQCIAEWLRKSETCPICCGNAKTTDLISQLFFDQGEDSLSSSPPTSPNQDYELLEKVNVLEDELKESKESGQKFQEKAEALKGDVRHLKSELDIAQKRADENEKKAMAVEKENTGLRGQIANMEKINRDLTMKHRQMELDNSKLTVGNQSLRDELSVLKGEVTPKMDEADAASRDRKLCGAPRRRYNLRSSTKSQSGDGAGNRDTKTELPTSKASKRTPK